MSKLRLEVLPDENVKEVCTQAARIASHIGVEVVFDYNGKVVTAKPGMDADSLVHECTAEVVEEKQPVKEKVPKAEK